MNGVVYVRNVGDQTLTFAVSGMLWESSLVMIDEETESLWSHLLGASMKGPLEGEELEVLRSLMTDWESWRTRYGESSVAIMSRTSNYNRQNPQMRNQLSIGITINGDTRYWPLVFLAERVDNVTVGNVPIVAVYHEGTLSASIYDRRLDDQELRFDLNSPQSFRDRKTGSVWDLYTGKALSGPLEGKQLARLPAMVADMLSWNTFHPEGVMAINPALLEGPDAEVANGSNDETATTQAESGE